MHALQEAVGQGMPVMWITAAVVLILGLAVCFIGYRLGKFLLGIVGCAAGFSAGFLVSRMFLENLWICIAIGVILALVFACLAFFFYQAGMFFLCAAVMFFVIRALLHEDVWWVYLAAALAAAGAGTLGVCFAKPMLIIVTGLLGAYYAVDAAFVFYEPEMEWMHLAAAAVLAIAGIAVQFFFARQKKEEDEQEKKPHRRERRRNNSRKTDQNNIEQKQRHERRRRSRQEGK